MGQKSKAYDTEDKKLTNANFTCPGVNNEIPEGLTLRHN